MGLRSVLNRLRPKDKRLRALSYTAGFMFLLTATLAAAFMLLGYRFTFEKFWEPMFVSWMGGAALFIFSIVISVIQLDDPTEEGAARRVEILMQGREGPHVEYFKEQLRTIEQFAEKSERRIVLKRLSEDKKEIFVEVHTTSIMRNFIDDISTTYAQPLGLTAHQVEEQGGVAYLRIDDKHQPKGQFGPGPNFSGTYPIRVPQGKSVRVDFGVYRWVKLADDFDYTPAKYIRDLTVLVENELSQTAEFQVGGVTIGCVAGSRTRIFEALELRPRVKAYSSKITLSPARRARKRAV
jgi:hypothetical protein